MSQNKIPQRQSQSFQDFAYRFQLAQGLPYDQKGIIFIGNTRAGKSTLALSMTGAQMKIVYESGNFTFINPIDESFKHIVKNTQQSVTQKPNFYKSSTKKNKFAIVDMPGHADSSRFKELINFHYIKTMASNLKYVRFLLVITMQVKNEKVVLPQSQIQMLNSFRIMFPGCNRYIRIIINRVQNLAVNGTLVKKCFRQTVSKSKDQGIRMYYGEILDNQIYVIQRPPYRKSFSNQSRYEKLHYQEMNQITKEIYNDSQAQFMKLSQHDYYSLNIFKEGDNENNIKFYQKLQGFVMTINKGVQKACDIFEDIVNKLVKSVAENKSCEKELISLVGQFLKEHNIQTPDKKKIQIISNKNQVLLQKSYILQLLKQLNQKYQDKVSIPKQPKQREKYYKDKIIQYMSIILNIIEWKYHRGQLYNKIMDFTLYIQRRITECYFISKIAIQQQKMADQNLSSVLDSIINDINILISDDIPENCYKIVDYFVKLHFQSIFNHYQHHYITLQKELLNNYKIILQNLPSYIYEEKEDMDKKQSLKRETSTKEEIRKKIEELKSFVVIHSEPTTPQQITSQIKRLLDAFTTSDLQMRIKILYKMARLLQRQKYYKNALIIYVYLRLNEEAMRLFTFLEVDFKKQEAINWSSQIARLFEENGMLMYAQRCLQIGKKWAIDDLDKFIELQKKVIQLNDYSFTKSKIESQSQINNKQKYWNWQKIKDQITVLKNIFSNGNSPVKSLLLKSYR